MLNVSENTENKAHNLRFTTRMAFRVRERELFVLMRMRKSERMFTDFAKELLVAVFILTVFVEVGRTAVWARRCWIIHLGEPAFC